MSLYLLNEHRTDVAADYRRTSRAPAGRPGSRPPRRRGSVKRSSTASTPPSASSSSTAGGDPAAAEYHEAIRAALAPRRPARSTSRTPWSPTSTTQAMRRSHEAGVALVGGEVGTPITLHRRRRVLRPGPQRHPARRRRRPTSSTAPGCSPATRSSSSSSAPGTPPGLHLKEEQMTTMTPAEADAVWAGDRRPASPHRRPARRALPEQWDHPSLCQGWTVRHVAAHLTLQQQRSVTSSRSSPTTPGCCAA